MKTCIRRALNAVIWVSLPVILVICFTGLSFADEESWKKQYNRLCGKSHEAVSMTEEDLASHIKQCDELLRTIDQSDYLRKKIYLFRIEKCRNFYQFLIDSKKDGDL